MRTCPVLCRGMGCHYWGAGAGHGFPRMCPVRGGLASAAYEGDGFGSSRGWGEVGNLRRVVIPLLEE